LKISNYIFEDRIFEWLSNRSHPICRLCSLQKKILDMSD